MADYLNIAGRVRTTASDGVAMEAQEVKDLNLNKSQQEVNSDVQNDLGDRYTKEETYNRDQLNELITTPDVNRVYVIATNLTTAVTDLLPATGSSDTLYNVGNWDGTQYDTTVYSIYGWDGTAYVCLAVRSFIGEVYDISANHPDGQGNPTPYADLTAAIGTGGANVPVGIRRGGMSIKFIQGTVQSSDNKYVQFLYMSSSTANADFTNVANWQGVDEKPTVGSDNLVKSGGTADYVQNVSGFARGLDFSTFTKDREPYTKGILFAGVVLKSGFSPSEITIVGLAKNRNSSGVFTFRVYFGATGQVIIIDIPLSTTPNGVCCVKEHSDDYGDLYLIVDISKYADGEVVIFRNSGSDRVSVVPIQADDARICNWQNEYIDTNVEQIKEIISYGRGLDFSTAPTIDKSPYLKGILFVGVVLTDGFTPDEVTIIGLAKNKDSNGKFQLWVFLGLDENDNTRYVKVEANLSDIYNGVCCLKGSSDYGDAYLIVDVSQYSNGEVVIWGYNAQEKVSVLPIQADDQRICNWQNEYVDSIIAPINNSLLTIQEQFRMLDFSNFAGNKQPYYDTIVFAAIEWPDGKPSWAVSPEIFAIDYNHNNYGRLDVGIYLGVDNGATKSIWMKYPNAATIISETYFSYTNQENFEENGNTYRCNFYLICSPKAIAAYHNESGSIIFGGTAGTRVIVTEVRSDDPRLVMFNIHKTTKSKFWVDKKMVWYGTSIPAGSDSALDQEGIGVTYPEICASYLGALCNNEAVGSSRAAYLPAQSETYERLMRCMGGTIASKLSLFNSIYVIDDDNQSVSLGSNPYNVTSLPVSGTPTYAKAVSLRLEAIMYSYEIKLISKYLDSTGTYLQSVLNSADVAASIHYSGTGYDLLHTADMDYKFTPDLFVFDHGTNDHFNMMDSDVVSTRNMEKFYGAMNTYYDLIQFYAPTSLVCIVTDYGNSRWGDDLVIDHQMEWAKYWQIPCLRTCDVVPWNGTTVTVQGYWDGGSEQGGIWHDEGFYFTADGDSWETNNGIILRSYSSSTSASTIVSTYNIRTVLGKQVYDIPQKRKFFKDGLHPHTDKSGNALKLYARYLSRMIDAIAPNRD